MQTINVPYSDESWKNDSHLTEHLGEPTQSQEIHCQIGDDRWVRATLIRTGGFRPRVYVQSGHAHLLAGLKPDGSWQIARLLYPNEQINLVADQRVRNAQPPTPPARANNAGTRYLDKKYATSKDG